MKTHQKIIKTIIATAIISGMSSLYLVAEAQDSNAGGTVSSQQIATSIVDAPTYSDSELMNAGCAPVVWKQMTQDYKQKATINTQYRNQIQVNNQRDGSPTADQVGRCFDSAAQTINNATRAYNTIAKLLTGGGLDSGQLYAYAQKVVIGAACSQVNSYISQSGLNTSINGGVGTVNSGIGNTIYGGNTVGGVNTGSVGQILNGGGYTQNNGSAIPNVNSGTITNGTGLAGAINGLNPFK